MKWWTTLGLDLIVVLLFATIGRLSHGEAADPLGVLTTAWPFVIALAVRDLVNQIYIDDAVRGYIVDLVRATRFPETVDMKLRGLIRAGASPRATINLALAARANAFMHHRSFVTPQDIKDLAHDILRHRILLSYEAEAENISTDDVIDHILTKVPVP